MKESIILIGGGGHCKACIDVIERENKFTIAGIVDLREKIHRKILEYEVIACDEDLLKLAKEYRYFLITIGQIKSADKRIEKFGYLKKLNVEFPIIASPFTCVSKYTKFEEGTIVMHNAFVNAGTKIGKNCIINTNAIIEHDVVIEDHCHISTGSVVNGGCYIGANTFVGSNSVLFQNVHVPSETVIGAGSVVINSLKESGIYVGNPVRRIDLL